MQNLLAKIAAATTAATSPAAEPMVLVSETVTPQVCYQEFIPKTDVDKLRKKFGDKLGISCKERGFGTAAGTYNFGGKTDVERFTRTHSPHHMHQQAHPWLNF